MPKQQRCFRVRGRTCPFTYMNQSELRLELKRVFGNSKLSDARGIALIRERFFDRAMALKVGTKMKAAFYCLRVS